MKFWLTAATASASEVDHLIFTLILISCAVLALVFGLMFRYMFKYRAGSDVDRSGTNDKTWRVEVAWTSATLVAFLGLFIWGADLYVRLFQPPPDALKIYVIGKQWMWKVEHIGGQREIDAVHVPAGIPVQLVMTSEDVIHDFSVPAFRIKHDVLPGRYETLWFRADVAGTYPMFCTQFCGIDHARMLGEVVVLPQPDYQKWLERSDVGETLADGGKTLFMRYGCSGCHGGDGVGGSESSSTVRAPKLTSLYGSPVTLTDGRIVTADERYLRDCILIPDRERVAGYAPVMPSFAGEISEEDLLKIIAYLQSLAGKSS